MPRQAQSSRAFAQYCTDRIGETFCPIFRNWVDIFRPDCAWGRALSTDNVLAALPHSIFHLKSRWALKTIYHKREFLKTS